MKGFRILAALVAVLFNCFFGGVVASAAGFAPLAGALVMNGIGLVMPFLPGASGVLMAGVYREIWTGEMIKKLRASDGQMWLEGIQDMSQYVQSVGDEAAVIHITALGVDPDVLINNTSYPIPEQALTDTDATISLDKYQTKSTPVTDDELFAVSFDKMGSVLERHKLAITDKKYQKAIHSLCPSGHATATPVRLTTGDVSVSENRKVITRADIIWLKKQFDAQNIPVAGRRLVLCNDHVNDLLATDQKFSEQYYNYESGKIMNMYGFAIYEYTDCPAFDNKGVKKTFGAEAASGDIKASVAFYAPRMTKATGWTKMYYSEAKTDPANQRNLVNFRHYFIVMPKKLETIGAIVSQQGTFGAATLASTVVTLTSTYDTLDVTPTAGVTYTIAATVPPVNGTVLLVKNRATTAGYTVTIGGVVCAINKQTTLVYNGSAWIMESAAALS
jgi:hypothetical protein